MTTTILILFILISLIFGYIGSLLFTGYKLNSKFAISSKKWKTFLVFFSVFWIIFIVFMVVILNKNEKESV